MLVGNHPVNRIFLTLFLLTAFCLPAHAQSNWTFAADMLVGRGGIASARLNGNVYVVGGNLGATVIARMDVYDSVSDTWATAPAM